MQIASSAGGIVATTEEGVAGGLSWIAARIAIGESASKGCFPVRSS